MTKIAVLSVYSKIFLEIFLSRRKWPDVIETWSTVSSPNEL